MFWESHMAMTLIDVAIIVALVFGAKNSLGFGSNFRPQGFWRGQWPLLTGLGIIGLFHIVELLLTVFSPVLSSESRAIEAGGFFSLNLAWPALVSTVILLMPVGAGFFFLIRKMVSRSERLGNMRWFRTTPSEAKSQAGEETFPPEANPGLGSRKLFRFIEAIADGKKNHRNPKLEAGFSGGLPFAPPSPDFNETRDGVATSTDQIWLMQTVLDAVPHAIVIKDRECRLVFANKAWCEFNEVKPGQMIGKTATGLPGKETSEGKFLYEKDLELVNGRNPKISFEMSRIGPGGEVRIFYDTKVQIKNEAGKVVGLVGIGVDITQRVQAEQKLRQNQRFQQTVFDAIPHSVSISDKKHRLLLVNHNALSRNNLLLEEVTGLTLTELKIGTDAERVANYALDQQVMDTGKPLKPQEMEWTLPSGQKSRLSTTKVPLFDEEGGIAGVVSVEEDITERKKMESQLRQAQKMEAVGQLAAGVAHDFNNMLQIIKGYSELAILRASQPEKNVANLKKVLAATQRAANLTRQLMAFSRQQVLQVIVFDVNLLIEELVKMLGRVIGENIDLKVIAGEHLLEICGDQGMIEQVLVNLCVNARDAMPGGGSLTIETENLKVTSVSCANYGLAKPGEYVLITVRDSGVGIEKSALPHIFEPFFTTKEVGKGTGIGLAAVHGIVEQHDGKITVFSEPGQGTTFRIVLPATNRISAKQRNETVHQWERGAGTILVAEDDEGLLELATDLLEEQGFRVLPVVDGERAYSAFVENAGQIDLVILDVVMPVLGGREACEKIRKLDPTVPVIFCTGYSADALDDDFLEKVKARVLRKPFSPSALFSNIHELLHQPEGEGSASPL